MRKHARWIGWTTVKGQPFPHYARNNWLGVSLTDPTRWERWDYASTMRNDKRGFVLGDGIGCLTVHDCVDEHGKVAPAVRAALPPTYTEITWDGRSVQAMGHTTDTATAHLTIAGYEAHLAASAPQWVPLTGKRVGAQVKLVSLNDFLAL